MFQIYTSNLHFSRDKRIMTVNGLCNTVSLYTFIISFLKFKFLLLIRPIDIYLPTFGPVICMILAFIARLICARSWLISICYFYNLDTCFLELIIHYLSCSLATFDYIFYNHLVLIWRRVRCWVASLPFEISSSASEFLPSD